eukprot:g1344.t1
MATAYETCTGKEATFTNYTEDFKGTLDYIWFSPENLSVLAISQVDDESQLSQESALPSSTRPSDHVSLVATFMFHDEPEQVNRRMMIPPHAAHSAHQMGHYHLVPQGLASASLCLGGPLAAMVKKFRKRENRKLAIVQQEKIRRRIRENRDAHNLQAPEAGTSFKHIKNKQKRSQMVQLMKQEGQTADEKKKQKSKVRRARREAEARGEEVVRQEPRSIDKMREADETIVPEEDSEVEEDEAMDEFEKYFQNGKKPKILVTTQKTPSRKMYAFLKETFGQSLRWTCLQDFTDVMLFHEKAGVMQGVYISHLPKGPTSYWRITRMKLGQEMKGGATCNSSHNPELILNNFVTRLGRRLARQFAALFPQRPDFEGRRTGCWVSCFGFAGTITFHNQRDFVFFRHYRYNFKDNGERCALQEIGPRFTLKCRYLQHGTFDARSGEYEYIWRPDAQVSRKKFFV